MKKIALLAAVLAVVSNGAFAAEAPKTAPVAPASKVVEANKAAGEVTNEVKAEEKAAKKEMKKHHKKAKKAEKKEENTTVTQ